MAKKESTLLQLVLSLCLISIVAAFSLAAVYSITKEPIEKSKNQKIETAIKQVLLSFEGELNSRNILVEGDNDSVKVNLVIQDGELFGAAVESFTNKAFSGYFKVMVGFDKDGNITGSQVLEHSETPGLGDKIDPSKSDFSKQFTGKKADEFRLKVKKDGGDVDAITAATISSRAYCDAIDRAYKAFIQAKKGNNNE
jgi:electron transport complex protein RnfG